MKKQAKKIFAWISIVLLLLLYISALLLALTGHGFDSDIFGLCIIGTILVPILCWIVIFLIDRYKSNSDT